MIQAHRGTVEGLAFGPDGRVLASAGTDGGPKLWDVATGQTLGTLKGHARAVVSIQFGPDNLTLMSSGHDGTVRQWDVVAKKETALIRITSGSIRDLQVAANGRIVTGLADHKPVMWKRGIDSRFHQLPIHIPFARSITPTPEGNKLLYLDRGGKLHLWDVQANKEVAGLSLPNETEITHLCDPSKGQCWIYAREDGTIRVWNDRRVR